MGSGGTGARRSQSWRTILYTVLQFPSFVFVCGVFWWLLPLASALGYFKFLDFESKRNDMYTSGILLLKIFRLKMLRVGDRTTYRGGPCLYLCNHRSWADFFLDAHTTEGRGSMLSRWAVYVVFPLYLLAAQLLNAVVLFNRNAVKDYEAFNSFLDKRLASSQLPGLVVYPEGHRNVKSSPLPFKRGMLRYAYSRKIPVQVVISKNKELVLCEKYLSAGFGVTIVTGYSNVIKPADFDDFEAFFKKFAETFLAEWERVYSANPQDCVVDEHDYAKYEYPDDMKRNLVVGCSASIVLMLLAVVATAWSCSAFLSLFGSAWPVPVAVVLAWFTSSYIISCGKPFWQLEHPTPPTITQGGKGL